MSARGRRIIDEFHAKKYFERIRAIVEEQKRNPLPFGSSCRGCDEKTWSACVSFCLSKPRVVREGKALCVTHALRWEDGKK
jgi:hypothetical protein